MGYTVRKIKEMKLNSIPSDFVTKINAGSISTTDYNDLFDVKWKDEPSSIVKGGENERPDYRFPLSKYDWRFIPGNMIQGSMQHFEFKQ